MTVATRTKCMKPEQAKALVRMLYRPETPPDILAKAEVVIAERADEYDAHKLISYCLNHLMSDEDNALYIIEALGEGL